ncbi:DUF1707 domain-containing protein [Actinoplanes couchii]|uniref:DUF1707 domain-containing protein n=2 Tax=Actinoplanes couchii TaxID=403638 RepID=A0ABQ3XUB1_9ACTN|nr:hypothetical protein Aco03nite_104470 [Actinoplanes couchii]
MSDAERQAVTERLARATSEGRLTLDEFEQRVVGVLAARTFADVQSYLTDLPEEQGSAPVSPSEEVQAVLAGITRKGQWMVPRQMRIIGRAGSVTLDFTDALIPHPVVEIDVQTFASTVMLVLPDGASVDVESLLGNRRVVKVPVVQSSGRQHFIVRGHQKAGELTIRYQHEFWGWHW